MKRNAVKGYLSCETNTRDTLTVPIDGLRHILIRLRVIPPICLEVAPPAKPVPRVVSRLMRRVKALVPHKTVAKLVPSVPVSHEL